MASQLGSVTGNKRLRPNQLADMNARLSYLPQTLAAESQEEFQKAQISNMAETNKINQAKLGLDTQRLGLENQQFGLSEKNFGLSEKQFGLQEKQYGLSEQQLGLQSEAAAFNQKATEKDLELKKKSEMMATGVGAAGLGFNLMQGTGLKGTLGESINSVSKTFGGTGTATTPGGFWDVPIGASIAGGLMGFGASRMLPTKNKLTKFGVGAGVGALTGFFGGGDNAIGGAMGGWSSGRLRFLILRRR